MHRGVDARLLLGAALVAGSLLVGLTAGCSLFSGGDDLTTSQGQGTEGDPTAAEGDRAEGDDVQRHGPSAPEPSALGRATSVMVEGTTSPGTLSSPAPAVPPRASPQGTPQASPQPSPQGEVLEEAKAREKLRAERTQALVAEFLRLGREQLERSELKEARESFAGALELDPSNAEARALFDQAGALLGERPETVGAIARAAGEREMVRRAQARIEVERHVREGEMALERNDFDTALRAFENALLIVRWNPHLEESGQATEQEVNARLDSAREAKADFERKREEELRTRALEEEKEREQQELARTENRIARFRMLANEAFLQDRHAEAEKYCDEILRLDPENKAAADLKEVAVNARHDKADRDTRAAYRDNWREMFDELRYKNMPVTESITFPDEEAWAKIAGRGPLLFAIEDETLPAEDREVLRQLGERRLTVNFQDTSLDEVVVWLHSTTGLGFVISRALADSAGDIRFTITAPGEITAIRALDYLRDFSPEPIDWRVENGIVKIVSQDEPPTGQVLQIYDIRDLTKTITSFPAKDFNLRPSVLTEPTPEEPPEPAPIVVAGDKLIELIQGTIEPGTWDPPNSISQVSDKALIVRHQPRVQEQIKRLLADLRENAGTLINIETRFILVEDNFLEDIGVDFRGLNGQNGAPGTAAAVPNAPLDDFGTAPPGVGTRSNPQGIGTGTDAGLYYDDGADGDLRGRLEHLFDLTLGNDRVDQWGGLSLEFTYLDDTAVEAIMRAVEKSETAYVNDAPSITLFNGQRANITVMNNVTYVRDFEVEIAQGAVVADPIVDVIRDGTILDVRCVVSADKRFVTMELRPTVAKLLRPIGEFATSLAVGNDVIIQLPELKVERLRTTVTVPDGATLLLGGMSLLEDQDYESTMPWLGDIPIISFLVGRKGKLNSMRQLLILVRAKVIVPAEFEPTGGVAGY
ncbi:MAG: hypothetical protein AB1486_00035 [Planctomycetota bacterium]